MERPMLTVYKPYDKETETAMIYKGQTDRYMSLIWQNSFAESGDFEIRMPVTAENMQLFEPFDFVRITRDVPEPYGIVVCIRTTTNERGFSVLTVSGKMLSHVLNFRFVMPYPENGDGSYPTTYTNDGTAYTLIKSMVYMGTKPTGTTSDKTRHMLGNQITVNNNAGTLNSKEYTASADKSIYEAAQELATADELGFSMTVADDVLVLDINAKKESNTVFDEYNGDLSHIDISHSIDNLVTDVAVDSGGGLVERTGKVSDIYRIEKWHATPALYVAGSPIGTAAARRKYAEAQMSLNKVAYCVDAQVNQINHQYLIDYNIGDIVKLNCRTHGAIVQLPVTSVTESWEDVYRVQVQFGEPIRESWTKMRNNLIRRGTIA